MIDRRKLIEAHRKALAGATPEQVDAYLERLCDDDPETFRALVLAAIERIIREEAVEPRDPDDFSGITGDAGLLEFLKRRRKRPR
jgi:hypothetical protein